MNILLGALLVAAVLAFGTWLGRWVEGWK